MRKRLPDSTRLYHALQAATRLVTRLQHVDLAMFLRDEDLQDIVARQFIIIGEAANHLSPELLTRHPAVDWRQVVRFRNFVVHEYFRVDYTTVWDTATGVIPTLITQLEVVLADTLQEEARNQGV